MSTSGFVERLRRPEYTGENRCIPCTATNTVIAAVLAAAVWYVWTLPAAAAVFAVGLAAIYVRGYLVPYTPELTKRYFPDRVLRLFDKEPATDAPVAGESADVDPEPILLEAGAIEVCRGGEDLCPTEEFSAAWAGEMASLRDGEPLEPRLAEVLAVDADSVAVEDHDEFVVVRAEGRPAARWESRAALLADLAALPLLRDRIDDWDGLDQRVKGSLLNGTRVFLEECPTCGGEVAFSRETVESCCREVEVVALACADCGARLLEVEAEG